MSTSAGVQLGGGRESGKVEVDRGEGRGERGEGRGERSIVYRCTTDLYLRWADCIVESGAEVLSSGYLLWFAEGRVGQINATQGSLLSEMNE